LLLVVFKSFKQTFQTTDFKRRAIKKKNKQGTYKKSRPNPTFLERIKSHFGGGLGSIRRPPSAQQGIPLMLYGFQKQGFWTRI